MPVFRLTHESIEPLQDTSFAAHGVRERVDLQRLLKKNISVVAPDVLIIAEEFAEWDDSRRRIDLLGIDTDANLVVIELKRDDEGAHMDLQAIRYAAMVSTMTFERASDVYQRLLDFTTPGANAKEKLLAHLGWDDAHEDGFAEDVRIVLVSADFSKELTTAALWLNERDLDIRCVRLKPYALNGEMILDVQQVVPLPEAEGYRIGLREKAISRREAVRQGGHPTGYWFMNVGDDGGKNPHRVWDDCRRYGFMIAGGGKQWIDQIKRLSVGDKIFAYASGCGYVGFGEVVAPAIPEKDFVPVGEKKRLIELPTVAKPSSRINDADTCDWCVAVKWFHTLDRTNGVLKNHSRRSTVEQIRRPELVDDLLKVFTVESV